VGFFKGLVKIVKKVAPLGVGFIPVVGPALSIGLKVRSAAMAANKLRKGVVRMRQAKRAAGRASQALPYTQVRARRPVRRPRARRTIYRRRRR
jgi:hypothetical protein